MYKIGIVDDEPLIRESLANTIDWQSMECRVVFEAADGEEALDCIDDNKVDIILMDINMPKMTGLELVQEMNRRHIVCQVILISAYQDFKFARRAIKLGVQDYIAKPIRNSEVMETIEEAKEIIDRQRLQEEESALMQEEMEELTRYFTETKQLVSSQVLGNIILNGREDATEDMVMDILPEGSRNHATLVVKSRSKRSDVIFNKKLILGFIESIQHKVDYSLLQTMVNGDIVLVLFFRKHISANGYKVYAKLLSQAILDFVSDWEEVDIFIGISTLYNDIASMNHSYREAEAAARNHFFTSEQDIVFTDDQKKETRQAKFSIVHDLDYFYNTLMNNEEEAFDEQLRRLLAGIESYAKGNITVVKTLLAEICITITRIAASRDQGGNPLPLEQVLQGIEEMARLEDAYGYISTYLKSSIKPMEKPPEYSPAINKVIKYIRNNYMNPITLESTGNEVALNGSYLSRILKQETGRTFSDMVLEERMKAARDLLKNPRLRLNEIAVQVGYRDYSYFYQVFTKSEGVTPMNYRKSCKEI